MLILLMTPTLSSYSISLESLGLRQHVSQSTHLHGHTLDLIITRYSDHIVHDPPQADRFISDHASLLSKLVHVNPAVTTNVVTYRKLQSVDMDSLKNDLAASKLCQRQPEELSNLAPEGVDALLCNYNATLSRMIDRQAPLKKKTLRARPKVPWYNADIDNARRIRRKTERRWRKTKLLSDLIIFKSKKNQVTYLMNQARQVFYTNFIDENSVDQEGYFEPPRDSLRERMSYLFLTIIIKRPWLMTSMTFLDVRLPKFAQTLMLLTWMIQYQPNQE